MSRLHWLIGVIALGLAIIVGAAFFLTGDRDGSRLVSAPAAPAARDADAEIVSPAALLPGPPRQGVALAQRDADAPRPKPEAAKDFRYIRFNADVTTASPQACATFSAPLSAKADYSPYVAVEPAAPIALSVSGQTLCVAGLSFGESRELVLREGLPAADGRKLAREERTPIEFTERPAYVGFKGSGVILPRRDADGLAIETVNVDSVDVSVRRVSDRAVVFKRINEGYSAGAGDWVWTDTDEEASDLGAVVWQGVMDVSGPTNAPVTTVFPLAEALGVLEAGAYYVEIQRHNENPDDWSTPARAARWILFSDLALTTYRGADGLSVVARSLQTATTTAGAEVQLVARNNTILGAETAGPDGRVRFDQRLLRGEGPLSPRMVMAYGPEGDFAVLDLDRSPVDLSSEDIGGRAPTSGADVFVYLDRGVYRPGETVKASAMLRDAQGLALADRGGVMIAYRPNGIEAWRSRFKAAEAAGALSRDVEIAKSAPRGMWRVAIELDGLGEVASERFSVEDFVPQRVAVELKADETKPIGLGEVRALDASVRFLYGAPGAGLVVEGEARIEVDPSPFDAFKEFRFGLHDAPFAEERLELAPVTADGAGRASLALDLGGAGEAASAPLRVNAVVAAVEPGGRAVRESVRIPYRPRSTYFGVKSDFESDTAPENAPIAFEVAAISAAGAATDAKATWTLVRVDHDYDWWRDDGGQWRWRSTRRVIEIEKGEVEPSKAGPARIAIRALDWGDYTLTVTDPASGQAVASLGFWAGWGGQATDGVAAPDRVRLQTPATPAVVGAPYEVAVLAPYAGVAEIVLATDRVLEVRTVDVPADGAKVRFDVTPEWGAGAYVMASVFTPRDAAKAPLPRRAVGVAHLPVDVAERTLKVALSAPEVVRPRQRLDVEVALTGGARREPAFVTLAAVDEGVLRLTKFESPDPVGFYFGQKALQIELRDDYGRLLDPNLGAAAEVRAGGDQLGGEGLTVVPTKTVALFSGIVETGEDGKATIPLNLPDFNGELRLMAVAWTGSAVGGHAQALTVRDAVPAEIILPRFLAPGDTASATLTVDNVEGKAGSYSVEIEGAGSLVAKTAQDLLTLASNERRDEPVAVTADAEGIGEVRLSLGGPDAFEISRRYPMQVRSPYLPTSQASRALMEPGERYSPARDLLAGYVSGSGAVTVSFSSLPIDAAALYDSLDQYPYGCTEQITSRALPLLYAGELAALAERKAKGDADVALQTAVSTLLNRQGSDGAFGLWREGDGYASPWLGAYATDFVARAKEAGFAVPDAALDRAYSALTAMVNGDLSGRGGYDSYVETTRWNPDTYELLEERAQAYALYVLARAGRVDASRVRYMHDERLARMRSPLAKAHLGAALAAIGDQARAANAFAQAEASLGFTNQGDYYQTARRDLAGLVALATEAQQTKTRAALADRLAEDLPDPSALTTQEKAFLLLASHALIGGEKGPEIETTGAGVADESKARFSFDDRALAAPENAFVNASDAPVWRTTIARGSPASPPAAAVSGVDVEKTLRKLDGGLADPANLRQGDRLIVSILVRPLEQRTIPLVIADLLPAGFEIEATLNPDDAGGEGPYGFLGELARPRVAEARDDRFVAAIDLRGEPVRLAYIVRAVTPGRFAAAGAVAEDMYRPEVFGRSAAFAVTVAPRG